MALRNTRPRALTPLVLPEVASLMMATSDARSVLGLTGGAHPLALIVTTETQGHFPGNVERSAHQIEQAARAGAGECPAAQHVAGDARPARDPRPDAGQKSAVERSRERGQAE